MKVEAGESAVWLAIGRVLALAALAIVAVLPGAPTAQQADLAAQIQSELDASCARAGFPGATIAIVMPDDRVYVAATGWADRAHTARLAPTSRMPAGSVGKTFVAAAILRAVDAGTLALDEKISRWLGREPWFGRLPNGADLTLRTLLSHRTGMPDPTESKGFFEAMATDLDRRWTPEDLIGFVLDKKPRSKAGTKYFYSDANYVVAGLVFERATGTPLFDAIDRQLLSPLGLDQTVPTERRVMTGVVPGLLERDAIKLFGHPESVRDGHFVYAAQAEYAGGGLISTSRDLARWAKALYDGRVLSEARLREMLTGQRSEGGNSYGLGVEISSSGAGPMYGHDGAIPGYVTMMLYVADYRVAAAIQINSDLLPAYKRGPGGVLGDVVSIPIRALRGRTIH